MLGPFVVFGLLVFSCLSYPQSVLSSPLAAPSAKTGLLRSDATTLHKPASSAFPPAVPRGISAIARSAGGE